MTRTVLALLLAAMLAVPGAAFAQGAGDSEYQDPFPETQTQQDDDGLSDEPPVPGDGDGGGGSGGDGGAGGDGGGGGNSGGGGDPGAGDEVVPEAPAPRDALPNTGSEPLWLAAFGLAFLLIGSGLRLRTIDPDAF